MNTKSRLFLFLSVITLCFFSQNVFAQLSGTYTIDPKGSGASNYKNFSDAAADLNTNGVSGPVVIKVANGTYKEQFELDSIVGADSTNTITFQSSSVDSSKVILQFPNGKNSNYLIRLNGTSWINFKHLTFKSTSDTGVNLVRFENNCHHLNFIGNRFLGKLYGYISGLRSYSSKDKYLIIENNLFKYSYYGTLLYGSHLLINRNVFDSFYGSSICVSTGDWVTISGNRITNTISGDGLTVYGINGHLEISNNYVNMPQGMDGLAVSYCYGNANDYQKIYNNFVILEGTNNNGGLASISAYSCSYQQWEFNNVRHNYAGGYAAA